MPDTITKPPYRVPLIAELGDIPDNGLRVASTFTGAGGSCLGFRLAGYRTLYASEFIPAAQATYRANFPDVFLDTRDVREVHPDDILRHFPNGVDVLEGSPPCASFSTSGQREATWGQVRKYSDTEQRVDDLFDEYVRLVAGVQPRVFVAENVSGLVKGVSKGYFQRIIGSMRAAGYRVAARVLDAQWLGVPQRRQRVIFIGVRTDLDRDPVFPEPLPYRYTVRDALPHIARYTFDTKGQFDVVSHNGDDVAMTMTTASAQHTVVVNSTAEWRSTYAENGQRRKLTIPELARLCGFPDDFQVTGTFGQQWERFGRAVPPPMMAAVARALVPVLCAD